MKYMNLLISQDRPDHQKHNLSYFISGNQLFKLTAHDMKSSLINEKLENHGSQTYSSKRVKVVNRNPTETPSTVPTTLQASCVHTFFPECAHSLMTTQCNQSQSPNQSFAVPQFMAQHNCVDQDPTDDPSAVPTASQASCDVIIPSYPSVLITQ